MKHPACYFGWHKDRWFIVRTRLSGYDDIISTRYACVRWRCGRIARSFLDPVEA